MVDWRGTTAYSYDALNRVISVTQPGNSVVSYAYDAVGNRTSITYPDGKVVRYQYDALNRLTQTADWSSQTTTSGYDAASNLVSTAYPNGASTAYAYDSTGRLLSVTNRSGANVNSAYTYLLDKVGNRMEVASYNEGVQRYGYDPLYRLTSWASPSKQTVRYGYDPVGNRLSLIAPTGTVNYIYDAADELLTAGATAFAYDGNGNQISKTTAGTTLTYGWDAVNRLFSVTGSGANTQYQYDGDGNRVSQQTSAGTYAYVNDTATPLSLVVNENGPDGNISYAYGNSLISASATGLQSFYQFDGLGSVVTVTDGAASQKASYDYEPWGSVIGGADLLGTKNKFRFTGQAVDPGSGLVFLRARYYDPGTGRFIGRDPMLGSSIFPPARNGFQYALSNPTRLTDPSGSSWFDSLFDLGSASQARRAERQAALDACLNDQPECGSIQNQQQYYQPVQQEAKDLTALGQQSVSLIYNPTTIGLGSPVSDAYTVANLPSDVKSTFFTPAGGDATGNDICIVNPYACGSPAPAVLPSGPPALLPRGPHK
jgi:RHS repeat-associated protein